MADEKRYTNSQISHCPHDLLYACNKGYFKQDEPTDPVHFELPYPLHNPTLYEGADVVTSIIKEKENYSKIRKRAKPHLSSTKKTISKRKSGGALLPLDVLKLYKTPDPDVYFNCDYNFYYTGGCIDCVTSGTTEYYVRPNHSNELWAYDLKTGNDFKLNYKASSPITSLRATHAPNGIFFTIREKNVVHVIFAKNLLTNKFKVKWKNESPIPFIDAKLNSSDTNIIATVKADFSLNIYNIKQNKMLKTFAKDLCHSTIDCFSQMEFWNRDSLVFANRNSMKLFDVRTDEVTDFSLNLEPCNTVCCLKIFEDSIYVATRHDLLKYDLRNLSQTCEHSSHFLSFPPSYMDITECYDDIFIVLSAQNIDQKVLFGTKSLNKLPVRIPSLLDTLKQCQLTGHLLLRFNLEEYLNQCVTGIKLIENGNLKFLISTNCTGQLFQQRIRNEPFDISEPVDRLHDWLKKFPETTEPLEATAIVDMTKLFEMLIKDQNAGAKPALKNKSRREKFIKKYSAKYTKDNYNSLMGELMSIWEVDNSDVKTTLSDDAPSESKVASWIEAHSFEKQDESE